jgi:hypothetical protein
MHGALDSGSTRFATRRNAERRIERRALLSAVVASAVLHAAALIFIDFVSEPEPRATPVSERPLINIQPVMRAYDIAAVDLDATPIEERVSERLLPVPVPRVPSPWDAPQALPGAAAPTTPEAGASARDRLQYRMGSAEVWRPQTTLPVEELSPDEIVRARVASQLQEYNDSVSAESAARARATDWTVKDGSGGKWGVSPGSIHLGGITLPLPFALNTPAGRRDEVAGRIRSWTEIQDQAARAETREIFDDRVRAIRERNERERARRNETTGGG